MRGLPRPGSDAREVLAIVGREPVPERGADRVGLAIEPEMSVVVVGHQAVAAAHAHAELREERAAEAALDPRAVVGHEAARGSC